MKKFLRFQFGFTLIETMLAIGISTGTALIIYKVLGESQKGQQLVENRDDLNHLHREIVGKFTDRFTCTNSLKEGLEQNKSTFSISKIINEQMATVMAIPYQSGKIRLIGLEVLNVDRSKNQAEVQTSYEHTVSGKSIKVQKQFRLELSFKENKFEGCISRGTLGLDPKEACDLVVGTSPTSESYFYNGKCNFAQAACEQSGRVWDTDKIKCLFSEDDHEALRQEICGTLGFDYSKEQGKCLPTSEMIQAVEEYQKKKSN